MIKKHGWTLILCLFLSADTQAIESITMEVLSVKSVYDGDTFRVDLKDSGNDFFTKNIPVRILGIDAPEIRGKCLSEKNKAIKSRDYLRKILSGEKIVLKNVGHDKYFRLLADVYVDEKSVKDLMLKNNFAGEYNGSKKISWC